MGNRVTSQTRFHLAFFLPSLVGGGAERVILTLIQEYCQRGHQVDLILAKATGVFLSEVPNSVRIYDCDADRVLFAIPALVRYLREKRPDSILSAMEHSNVATAAAVFISRVPVKLVLSTHTNLDSVMRNAKTIKARFTKYWIYPFYHYADRLVAVSAGVADGLVKLLNLSPKKISIIYNPVVTQQLLVNMTAKCNHEWFNSRDVPVIVAVGRLTEAKDYPTLIAAFAKAKSVRPLRLLILGDGELRGLLENFIDSLGLTKNDIQLHGFVDNPYSYMRSADLFVISSSWEGFGNVLAEALACGVKVVSTDYISGAREILENGRWGIIVPIGNINKLAEAIIDELSATNRVDASAYAQNHFGVKLIADKYLEILSPFSIAQYH